MPRVSRGPKPTVQEPAKAKSEKADRKGGASKAQKAGSVGRIDAGDTVDDGAGSPSIEKSSPLSYELLRGLTELARRYYGDLESGPADGLKVLLKSASDQAHIDVDRVISKELRELKANQLTRDIGVDQSIARELVDNLSLLLAPTKK